MNRITQYALLITLLLVAFFFRTHELAGLGLGLEHDEVAEWQIADGIRHGQHALFFKEAYGQEPLFLYLMAGSTMLIGDNIIGVRFTSVFVAMLTLAAAYRLLRRMFSPTIALVAVAFLAIALWPVFWGRVALRAMTLPLMLCLAFDFLWRGLMKNEGGRRDRGTAGQRDGEMEGWRKAKIVLHAVPPSLRLFIAAGIFFGLAAYTYLSARALPILLAALTVYLALFARDRMQGRWRGLFVSYLVGAVVALPLMITLLTHPDLQFRVSEVSGPLDKAMQGDWREVGANVGRAVGMFTVKGDSTVRDNWPDRPVFPEPIGAALFGAGVLIAITKWRQPRYALALIWIGAMLIPAIVTTGAPNFTRALGALPMVFALPGLTVEWLLVWLPRLTPGPSPENEKQFSGEGRRPLPLFRNHLFDFGRGGRGVRLSDNDFKTMSQVTGMLIGAVLIGVLAVNAVSTWDDYFNKWPHHPETQFVFQADFAAIAKDIDASGVTKVYVGGLSNDTMDDSSLYLLRVRKDVQVGWFDSGSPISSGGALMDWFTGGPTMYVPSIVPISPLLMANLSNAKCIETAAADRYRRYQSQCDGTPGISPSARRFEDTAIFVGASDGVTRTLRPGEARQFTTTWRAANPIAYPRRVFVHLLNPQTGRIIAQHDGLDSPTKYWRPDDSITQAHTLLIPADAAPGLYELWAGLYNPTNGRRVPQRDLTQSQPPNDHIVLGQIEIMR